jgi:hypothetical protein
MLNLCAPALIYVAFSLTQIIIDTFKGLYNTAFFKTIIMIIITILPFIFMSVIVAILLYVFGLDPATGKLNIECDNCNNKSNTNNGNLVFRSTNKYMDVSYSDTPLEPVPPTDYSSDPQYE